ncbi:MAG: hypothetical protein JO121_08080 [Deltaproteobacteria bacterium]|nr:hypothetical protein [Deltaproteobacteria bacterium]
MHRASLLFRGLAIVGLVIALAANCARAQSSQPRDNPAYGQQPQGDDQNATSQGSDDSRDENSSARPEQDDSGGSTDSDQNNNNESNDSDSSEQENQ